MKKKNKLIDWILDNYILFAALLGLLSFIVLHQGAKKRGEKTKVEISNKVEKEIENTINAVDKKFNETLSKLDSSTEATIGNIQEQGKSVIDELSKESKKGVKEVQIEMDKLKNLSEKINITNTPIILELKYVVPTDKINPKDAALIGQSLAHNFNLAVTIMRNVKGKVENTAHFVGSPTPFSEVDLNQARSYPVNFSKENTFVIYGNEFWIPEKDKFYIYLYIKLLPSELINFTSLKEDDKINIIRTQKRNISQELPGKTFYDIKPLVSDCKLTMGNKTYNLKTSESSYVFDGKYFASQIIHYLEVEK